MTQLRSALGYKCLPICRQLQVHARDFHLLVRVLDPNVREGNLAIHDGQVQFSGKGNLGPLVPAIILRLCFAELKFFLQLVVELNAEDLPTLPLDLPNGLGRGGRAMRRDWPPWALLDLSRSSGPLAPDHAAAGNVVPVW